MNAGTKSGQDETTGLRTFNFSYRTYNFIKN